VTYLSLLIGPSPAVRCGVQDGVQEKLERWLVHLVAPISFAFTRNAPLSAILLQ
jgi:hypothetical protein